MGNNKMNPDTMTPAELSHAIAGAMGWALEYIEISYMGSGTFWVNKNNQPVVLANDWSPPTNWSHWGMVYEFMRGKGWESDHHTLENGSISWEWFKIGKTSKDEILRGYADPDIRTAMLKSALMALRGEGKGE